MTDEHQQQIKWRYQTPEISVIEAELTGVALIGKAKIDGFAVSRITYFNRGEPYRTDVAVEIMEYTYQCEIIYDSYDGEYHTGSSSVSVYHHTTEKKTYLPWESINSESEDKVIIAFLERVKHHLDTSKGDTP